MEMVELLLRRTRIVAKVDVVRLHLKSPPFLFPGKSFFLFVVPLVCLRLLILAVVVALLFQLLSLVGHSIHYSAHNL